MRFSSSAQTYAAVQSPAIGRRRSSLQRTKLSQSALLIVRHSFPPRRDRRSVMWNRQFSQECFGTFYDKYHACNQLRQVLDRTGCKRLVIGHTPQVRCCLTQLLPHKPAELWTPVTRTDIGSRTNTPTSAAGAAGQLPCSCWL